MMTAAAIAREGASPGVLEGTSTWDPHFVQWVIKASKRCNLRCAYCYEFPFLGDPTRMSVDDIRRMFIHIGDYYAGASKRMDFVWHGGEPLLFEPEFYRTVEELEHEILDPRRVPFTNSVQTNLTVMNDGVLDLVTTFFDNVGVSLDLFGNERVNVAGHVMEERVIQNMQTLDDHGVRFGCITVLSRHTAPHVAEIYDFFAEIGKGFRLLPIYRTGYEGQQATRSLGSEEIVEAFKLATDRWFAAEDPVQVLPITDYIWNVIRRLDGGGRRQYYNKMEGEVVFVVDTDGTLYSNADAYEPALAYGSIFSLPLDAVLSSEGHARAVSNAEARMRDTCHSCRYFGACWGYYMAEATPEQRWTDSDGQLVCGVAAPMHRYVEDALRSAGLVAGDVLIREELVRRLGQDPASTFVG